jgi:hypothetical protein
MKYIKRIDEMEEVLNKDKSTISRIAFYDFDGTIIDSPMPDIGKLLWAKKKGKLYPYMGWWSKPESLDLEVFDIKTIKEVESRFQRDVLDKNCWVVLLTNRIDKLIPEVSKVLNLHSLKVDEFQMMSRLNFPKSVRIKNVIQDFPQLNQIDILDDDERNIRDFVELRNELQQEGLAVTIYKVTAQNKKDPIKVVE